MSIDWIDLVRETEPFELFEREYKKFEEIPSATYNEFAWSRHNEGGFPYPNCADNALRISIDKGLPVEYSDGKVGFLFLTNPTSVGSSSCPYAPPPAPAQRASHITMIWTKDCKTLDRIGFDGTVGEVPPENALGVHYDKLLQYIPGSGSLTQTGSYLQYLIEPHRDDGFPAVISIGNLRKHYNSKGQLHRTGNTPALRADYVGALWYDNGESIRSNGPRGVLLEDYQEFHREGIYEGFRCKRIFETWDNQNLIEQFSKQMEGKRRPLANRYFENPSDEMIWTAYGVEQHA